MINIYVSKHNTLTERLVESSSSMLDEIASRTVHKDKESDLLRKRNKTLNEVKPVETISKDLQSLLEISPMQNEVLPSDKLQEHAHELQNLFRLN